MKDFDLTTAVALVITTSLASNLLWVMAFGPPASGLRTRLRSTLDGLCSMLWRPAGAWMRCGWRAASGKARCVGWTI